MLGASRSASISCRQIFGRFARGRRAAAQGWGVAGQAEVRPLAAAAGHAVTAVAAAVAVHATGGLTGWLQWSARPKTCSAVFVEAAAPAAAAAA